MFTCETDNLIDFSKSIDTVQNTFGGELIFKIKVNSSYNFTHLDLGNVNGGVTERYINEKKNWKMLV